MKLYKDETKIWPLQALPDTFQHFFIFFIEKLDKKTNKVYHLFVNYLAVAVLIGNTQYEKKETSNTKAK